MAKKFAISSAAKAPGKHSPTQFMKGAGKNVGKSGGQSKKAC